MKVSLHSASAICQELRNCVRRPGFRRSVFVPISIWIRVLFVFDVISIVKCVNFLIDFSKEIFLRDFSNGNNCVMF